MKKELLWKKTVALTGILALSLTVAAGCGGSSTEATGASDTSASGSSSNIAAVQDNGDGTYTVTVAVLDSMAPYTYTDENGEMQGYEYEWMLAVDELLDEYIFEYVSVSPDAAPAAIQAGTYAFSASAHFITPARESEYILSVPTSYYPVNLVSRIEDSFTTFEDLDGKVLVPNPPNDGLSVVLQQMSEEYPDVEYIQDATSEYIPYMDGVLDVVSGRYDCWFGGESMYADLVAEDPTLAETTFCSEPITTAACVAVINENLTDLREAINEATCELYENGTLAALSEEWLGNDYFAVAGDTGSLFDYAGYTSDQADWYLD